MCFCFDIFECQILVVLRPSPVNTLAAPLRGRLWSIPLVSLTVHIVSHSLSTVTSCPSLRTVRSHVYTRPVSCLLEPSYCRITAHHMYLFYSRQICRDGFIWRDDATCSVDTESAIRQLNSTVKLHALRYSWFRH